MANKYKVGDIVRVCDLTTMKNLMRMSNEYDYYVDGCEIDNYDIVEEMFDYCDKQFKIAEIHNDKFYLLEEDSSWLFFHEALLELVSEVSEVSKPKFKIGDNVQICSKDDMLKGSPLAGVTSTMLNYGHHVGKIIDVSDGGTYFKVTGADDWWFHESLLDKLEVGYNLGDVNDDFEEEKRTYKIGDMVQICGKLWMEYLEKNGYYDPDVIDYDIVKEMYAYCGKVGKVTQVYDYDDSYNIEGCGDWWFHSDMLLQYHTPQDLDGEIMDLGLVAEEEEQPYSTERNEMKIELDEAFEFRCAMKSVDRAIEIMKEAQKELARLEDSGFVVRGSFDIDETYIEISKNGRHYSIRK